MKVLWFTNTPSLYKKNETNYNHGGWIESLEKIVSEDNKIELAISFFYNDNVFKVKNGGTIYYPIRLYNTKFKKIKHNLFYKKYDFVELSYYSKVINDFQPDIIHVFGTELSFGLITNVTKTPVVIHIQSILNPYQNAYFAPGQSNRDFIIYNIFKPLRLYTLLQGLSFFNHHTKRELKIYQYAKNLMGRTKWDKEVSALLSNGANYFYCGEPLRDVFYSSEPWKRNGNNKLILISTIARNTYKGFDLILKTAKLIKEFLSFDFEWLVYGIESYSEWEKVLGIKCKSVNIELMGIANSEILVKAIQNADIFVHPSYIDNSPNSVCEAQMIGIPVIATNVGGIPSLIEDGKTGFLIPANDPYTLAARIIELKLNPELMIETGINARECALNRHNKETILSDLLAIYNDIYEKSTNAVI